MHDADTLNHFLFFRYFCLFTHYSSLCLLHTHTHTNTFTFKTNDETNIPFLSQQSYIKMFAQRQHCIKLIKSVNFSIFSITNLLRHTHIDWLQMKRWTKMKNEVENKFLFLCKLLRMIFLSHLRFCQFVNCYFLNFIHLTSHCFRCRLFYFLLLVFFFFFLHFLAVFSFSFEMKLSSSNQNEHKKWNLQNYFDDERNIYSKTNMSIWWVEIFESDENVWVSFWFFISLSLGFFFIILFLFLFRHRCRREHLL